MTTSVGVSGAYKTVAALSVGVSGAYKTVAQAWVGVGGAWKTCYAAFSGPLTHTYNPGESGNETVPIGATQVVITIYGNGSDGQDATFTGSGWASGDGGDGGAKCVKTIAIDSSDWSTTLAYDAKVHNGGASTVTGTLNAGSVNMSAGSDGVVSGGDTNTAGNNGDTGGVEGGPAPPGGAEVESGIGNNGGDGAPGTDSATGSAGGDGFLKFVWT